MVLLVLYVKAELENVASITFPRNLQWCFDVKDAQSDETKEGVFLCAEDVAEVHGSKDDAEKEILEGRAHAYISSLQAVQFLVMNNSDAIDLPLSYPLVGWAEALAVQKGEQELLNFLNARVTARQADRWLDTTRDYWFSTLEWLEDVDR